MPRSPRAYLADTIDGCDAIAAALREVELSRHESDRLIRSAVEREFKGQPAGCSCANRSACRRRNASSSSDVG